MLCQLSYAPRRFEAPILPASPGGFGSRLAGNHAAMSENTIEQGDEAQAAEDELTGRQPGPAYRDDEEQNEEYRRELAEDEDAVE